MSGLSISIEIESLLISTEDLDKNNWTIDGKSPSAWLWQTGFCREIKVVKWAKRLWEVKLL